MRLIDADDLKEAFYNRNRTPDYIKYLRVPAELVYQFIDNAPTVESNYTTFAEWVAEQIFFKEVEDDLFVELACRKLEKLGLVEKTDSEWKMRGTK